MYLRYVVAFDFHLRLSAFICGYSSLQDFHMLVDSHAHLMFPQFKKDLDNLLACGYSSLQDFHMLVDSHAHLMFPQFKKDLDNLLARARAAGGGADCECGYKSGDEPCGYCAC